MPNSVDLVIGSEAIKQVEGLIAKLSLADAELIKISQSALGASKGISGISTPSGLDKAVTNTANLNDQLEKQNAIIEALEIEIKKLSYARQTNNKQSAEEVVNQKILNQNAISEAKATSALVGAYEKLDLEHKKAIINAQNLGVKYGETSTQFLKAADKANILDTKLKAIDASLGKNQRNVGNYASGYNALGNSINQLSREAPAFANSVNTGFMALSNNFPALFDAINGIRDKNKELIKDGQPTKSVFKELAGALFSWQTALSVGVTLLTLYGGKLVDFARGLGNVEMALKSLDKAQKESDKRIGDTTRNIETQAEIAINQAKRRGASQKELDQIKIKGQENVLINLQKERDLAKRTYDEAVSYRTKGIESVKLRYKEELDQYNKSVADKRKAGIDVSVNEQILKQKELYRKNQEDIKRIKTSSDEEVFAKIKENFTKTENAVKIHGQKLNLLNENIKTSEYDLNQKNNKKKKKKKAKEKKEDLDHLESYIKPVSDTVNEINKQIERLTFEKIVSSEEDLPEINENLKTLIELKEQLYEVPTGQAVLPDNFVNPKNSNASTDLKEDWKETFDSIANSAQQAGDIIAEFNQRNFDNEYRRLEAQKDISLKFAGDSQSAREKIELEYEKKRKEIAKRENKAKQKQAIFNIAIDTAQAIMATVGKTGFAGLPLALILGALGAAQIALVASQKIPEYWQGTDNHAGGLMLVNDGAGANFQEKVILPNGKEIMPEGRNVLMNAPKGTKVLTHEQQIMQMLNERGISMNASYAQNKGMTANEMDSIMEKHFANIQTNHTSFDSRGIIQWSERNGNRTIRNSNRGSGIGFKV